jgi:hypothetical protein
MRHQIFRQSLTGMAAMVIALAAPICASAAISEGPKYTNAVAAKENRNAEFFRAEQSYQEKLKVGKERYNQKQASRDKIIASMSAQLQARQQTVAVQPVAAHDDSADGPVWQFEPSVVVAFLAAGCIIAAYSLLRRKPAAPAPRSGQKEAVAMGSRPSQPRYRITALKPVTVLANTTKDEPAWIRLKAGEMRDKVGLVVGIHPDFVPNGKRVYLTGADVDIVPLEAWNDRELPKNFFEYFKLEISEPDSGAFSSRN